MKKASREKQPPTPEEFQSAISRRSVADVVERLGCKVRAVYGWRKGERVPEDWQRRLYLEALGK